MKKEINYFELHLEKIIQQTKKALSDEEMSGARFALEEIIDLAFRQTDDLYITHPELVETALRLIVKGNSRDYVKGITDAMKGVLLSDGFNKSDFDDDRDYAEIEKSLADAELQKLAAQISEISRNPLLPTSLFNVLLESLSETSGDDLLSPESVLYNLEILRDCKKPPAVSEISETDDFSRKILEVEFESAECQEMYRHFNEQMTRAVDTGRICTRERMAKLYPIFREINIELDEENERIAEEERQAKAQKNGKSKNK